GVLSLVCADSGVVAYYTITENSDNNRNLWAGLAERNPIRLSTFEHLWAHFSERQRDLDAANQQLAAQLAQDKGTPYESPSVKAIDLPAPKRPYNVVVIGVESFSRRMAAETNMPAMQALT